MKVRFGIDLGGTKIEIIALRPTGEELLRERIATPAQSYDDIVRAIRELVIGSERKLAIQGASVGIAIPGAVSPQTGRIKNANTTCLIGKSFDQDLEAALGRPVKLANDANCFTLSEATDGAAAGCSVVFGVIIGTGTGGGIVVHGSCLTGPNAIAGEWGHNPLPWPQDDERPGSSCYCGKSGCIETFLSGPGLARDHATRVPAHKGLSAREIAERAMNGDAFALTTLSLYEDRMARALASVMNVLDPDVIVLGGGLSNLKRLFERVPSIWGRYVFSDSVRTRLLPARHGDSSGVRGAAWLWPADAR